MLKFFYRWACLGMLNLVDQNHVLLIPASDVLEKLLLIEKVSTYFKHASKAG